MGATNFYKQNADKYYVFTSPIPQEGREEEEEVGQLDADDVQDMILYQVECNPHKVIEYSYTLDTPRSKHENRNYPSFYIGTFVTRLYCRKRLDEIEIWLTCFARCGYYEGICLDWEKSYYMNGNEIFEQIDFVDFEYNTGYSSVARCHNAYKAAMVKVQAAEQELINYVHGTFSGITEVYVKTAQFSNGEAVYEKYDSRYDIKSNPTTQNGIAHAIATGNGGDTWEA